jgi:hypothetical protein
MTAATPALSCCLNPAGLLEIVLARLDEAAMAVMLSGATVEQQHVIVGHLAAARAGVITQGRLDAGEATP